MEKHITVLGWLYIIFGILFIFGAIFMFTALAGIGLASGDDEALAVLAIIGTVFGSFLLVVSLPAIIGGVGLLKKQNWARILVLILAFLNLINIPIGTALGIYTIWALLNDESIKVFTAR
ncbi:MAG: hypothetical protein GY839_05860 [candidate division Zixibacteria bacterium]|nr:hypothetical protein [candidate division Zixibacteria bacterium]